MESTQAFNFVMSPEQQLLLSGALLVSLVLGTYRLGVLIAFGFASHWGFIENRDSLFTLLEASPGLASFCLLGGGLVLAVIYFKLVVHFVLRE